MAKLHPSIAEKYPNGVPPGTPLYQSDDRDENGERYLLVPGDVVVVTGPVGPQGNIPGYSYSPTFGYTKIGIVAENEEVIELEPVHPIVTRFGPHACPQCHKPWQFKHVVQHALYRCTCGYEFIYESGFML